MTTTIKLRGGLGSNLRPVARAKRVRPSDNQKARDEAKARMEQRFDLEAEFEAAAIRYAAALRPRGPQILR